MNTANLAIFGGIVLLIRQAGREGGWWLAIVVALLAVLFASYIFNPVREGKKHVVEPVAQSIGIVGSTCPGGWEDESGSGALAQVRSCERDGWIVVLNPDGSFDHAVQLDTPGSKFIFDEKDVPGWPRE